MAFTDDELRALERLAALDLDQAERARLRERLERLSALLDLLADAEPVDPHALGEHAPAMPWRDDEPGPTLAPDLVLSLAPRRRGRYFDVPRAFEDPS